IISYNTINKQFDDLKDRGIYINLSKFINKIEEKQIGLFNNETMYFFLLDKKDYDSGGYLYRRNEFNIRVKQSEKLCYSFIDKSFSEIFSLMIKEEDTIANKLYHKDIVEKLEK